MINWKDFMFILAWKWKSDLWSGFHPAVYPEVDQPGFYLARQARPAMSAKSNDYLLIESDITIVSFSF